MTRETTPDMERLPIILRALSDWFTERPDLVAPEGLDLGWDFVHQRWTVSLQLPFEGLLPDGRSASVACWEGALRRPAVTATERRSTWNGVPYRLHQVTGYLAGMPVRAWSHQQGPATTGGGEDR